MNAAAPAPADYQAFFDGSPELLFVIRVEDEFPIVAANDSFLRGTMTRRETLLGRGIFEAFPATPGTETDRSKRDVLVMLERLCRQGQGETVPPYRYDLPRPEAEGGGLEERHWQMSLTPLEPDAQGRPRFILGRSTDITAQISAEREIKDTRSRLEATLAAAEIGTWIWEVQANRVHADRNLAQLFNVADAEANGGPIERYLAAMHPDDIAPAREAIDKAAREGGKFDVEYRLRRADGTYRWVSARGWGERDPATGEVTRFPGVVLDISARKQAQAAAERRSAQLQRLAETSARLNTTLDVTSLLGVITAEARGLIGARHAVTTAAPVGTLRAGVAPVTVASHAEEALLPETTEGPVQTAALAVPLVAQAGGRIGVIELTSKEAGGFTPEDSAVLTQLAQIAARAIENARLYEELRASDKRKDEFLAMLAHELRNPLSAIRNAVALGSDTTDAADVDWAMDVIQRQVRQLSRMIDDLLDVSRITQGMIQLRKETLDVAQVFRRAADTAGGLLQDRGHRLTVDAPSGTHFVEADAVRLEQVLVNLLTNAAKYTDKGGEIVLSVAPDGGDLVLSVKDNGMGIPPDKVPQMFELFAQGNRTLARSEGGLGIGLTVVRSLVELHGGSVSARSEGPGQGSEFFVRLEAAKAAAAAASAPAAGSAPAAEQKARVLVVDDNEDSARAVARIIRRQGYDVQVAHDGPAAVETALAHRPEFIFLDIGLPGLSGYDVARRLRQEESLRGALLVAVSGYGEESDRRRSREAGFDQHLVKPVDPETLLGLMRA